jgi:iron complex outermembrane receptor protein
VRKPTGAGTATATTGSIDGRVVLQDGRPLPRFRVTIKETGQAVVTDDRGRFTFRNLTPGKFTLQAKGAAIGRELSGVRELVVPAGPDPARVEIRLEW